MKQLQKRILMLMFVVFIGFGWLMYLLTTTFIQEQVYEQQQSYVQNQLLLLESQLEVDTLGIENIHAHLQDAADVLEERLTFIAESGEVLFDSHGNVEDMENHGDRKEIQDALEASELGSAIRESTTLDTALYYIAVPIQSDAGQLLGTLRISKPIDEMKHVFRRIQYLMMGFVGLSLIVSILFTNLWAKRFSKPMGEISQVAEELSNRNYSARYQSRSYQEVNELGQTINVLAENLSSQVEAIEQNERQITELVQNLVIGVMLLNSDKQIEMTNPVMEELMGQNLKKKKGTHYIELINNYALLSLIDDAYTEKGVQNKEISLFYPRERIVDAHVVPYENELTKELNAIILLYDISNIRRLEKVRSDFVANASHELRTPMTALKGFTETLLDGAMDDRETLVEFLTIIQNESNRLDAIVKDILDLSKLENQAAPFRAQTINLAELIQEVNQMLQKKADEKNINLIKTVSSQLTFKGDRDRLKQVMVNLVDNAL